ncbi:T9SS type A sorting domain-containing protein [Aequorivita sp. H23M31]|uniref:T9SS type A sorting domain-containing protein n=1 Tax=Aequorivita ciconiae TaxID=2494375 RepID=A0A410G3Y4_9FLAO|nr:T9SS type A sorting domain-containing protein [Aequorivita sp. H23M31]QAA81977.1 T9SS type A sorting domain-containing protein [Aequorivita sp. H23M31]
MNNYPYTQVGLYLIPILFLCNSHSKAQEIQWEKSYGGLHSEYLMDAQPTADYGFILAGSSLSGKTGNKEQENINNLDYWIWKMDERGDLDWQKSFGGMGADFLSSITNTRDGGFILAGSSNSLKGGDKIEDCFGNEDYWIIKLNAKGDEEWQVTIGGSGRDIVKEIHQTKDGGYIVGGSSESGVSGNKTSPHFGSLDYWIVKLDPNGVIEWQRTSGGKLMDQLESILPTKDEGFIVGGWSNSPISGNKNEESFGEGDYWIIKLNKYGEMEWQRTLGGESDDHLSVLLECKEGGYLAGGNSRSNTSGSKAKSNGKGTDFWIIKLTETGEIEWQNTYDFGETDVLTSITQNEERDYLIGGHAKTENIGLSRSDKKGINDYIALKITITGEEKWKQTVGSTGEDNLRKLFETRDGGYLLAGTSGGEASRDKNTGKGKKDFWVVKLKDEDKMKERERFEGLEAFPNPTTTFTNVIVNHDFDSGDARVYDISGKLIQFFTIKNRTVPIDLQGLSVGVYIVTITTNVATESVKILKRD